MSERSCPGRHRKCARVMADTKPSPAKGRPRRLASRRPRGSPPRLPAPQQTAFPSFCCSEPLATAARPHLPTRSRTRGVRTDPDEQSHARNGSARTVWGEAHTKALGLGATFPPDELQLLPASSPSRWLILLRRACNYRLRHRPGWGAGADGRVFILPSPTSPALGAAGRAKGTQWGQQCWLGSERRKHLPWGGN